ncbi:MAG TPA: hypothetical protein VD931_20070 [Baekduia sp.]|nr:hypothetical protein [Baekduia sp.]
MALQRSMDGPEREPVGRLSGTHELRRVTRTRPVATGTLACPTCDAPVAPARRLSPAEAIACPFCDHGGPVRDFLTLGDPTRPAHVVVRLA